MFTLRWDALLGVLMCWVSNYLLQATMLFEHLGPTPIRGPPKTLHRPKF